MISCIGELVHFSVVSLAATRRTSYKDFGLLETVDFIELLSQVLDGLLDSIFASPDKLKSDGLSPLLSLYSRFFLFYLGKNHAWPHSQIQCQLFDSR